MKRLTHEITIVFRVNKEMVPGMFYDPQDFVDSTITDILYRLSAYEPVIVKKEITTPTADVPNVTVGK